MTDRPREIGERSELGEAYLAGRLEQEPLRGDFRLSRREDVPELERLGAGERARLVRRGLEVVRRGEIAYGILAAGASTRMDPARMPASARRLLEASGRDLPHSKALVPVVETGGKVFTFLDLFLLNVARFAEETGSRNPALLLVSEANAAEIRSWIAERDAYGLGEDGIVPFRQTLDRQIVATPEDVERARGNFAGAEDFHSAMELARAFAGSTLDVPKPAGHGEFLHQLVSSGTLAALLRRGIRLVSIRNIDNTGAVLDDAWLAALGKMVESEWRFVVEVSRRPDGPAGKGGALVVRPDGSFQLAEDPSFAGTGVDPRDSYYVNNAVAILSIDYLFGIYETSEEEVLAADGQKLAEIAERGRRKFPALLDVKPVRLGDGRVVGVFARETNLWESTGIAPDLGVGAVGVLSVKDVEEDFASLSPEAQRDRALRVRFAATKKWEDYEGINASLVPHVARRIVEGKLLER